MTNHSGDWTTEEPISFWGAVVNSGQSVPTYGPAAGTKAMDGFLCTTTTTGTATLVDQNGTQRNFATGCFVLGTFYPLSPSYFSSVGGGVFVPLFK
jgi:hypothetical protein